MGFAFLILVVTLGHAAPAAADDAAIGRLLQKGIARGYPGIAVMFVESDGKTRAAAAGYADLEHRRPMRVDDGFHIGSVNKTFTAVAALRLVDQGKLSLSETLLGALGQAAARVPYADRITVGQLLDHSSGTYATNNDMDYLTTLLGPKADPQRVWTAEEMVALADKDRVKPLGEPGSGHYYSDTNYTLLGMIVARRSGMPLKEYVRHTVFEPLGMRSTYFFSDQLKGAPVPRIRTALGYLIATEDIRAVIRLNPMFKTIAGEKRPEGELYDTTQAAERNDAAGGIVTTLPDLARFARATFGGRLLKPDTQRFLMASGETASALPVNQHRTWTMQAMRKPYGVLVYKEGDGPGGFTTIMAYLPAREQVFLGFTNSFGYFNEVDFMMDEVVGPVVGGR
jgi:D-alanyl-D-alanine carboxypeptidase